MSQLDLEDLKRFLVSKIVEHSEESERSAGYDYAYADGQKRAYISVYAKIFPSQSCVDRYGKFQEITK